MLALIQGSNRRANATAPVIHLLAEQLQTLGQDTEVIDLVELPGDVLHADMYESGVEHAWLARAEATLKAADAWLIAFPEYNGSFPGALKLFLDALSVRDYVGLFDGRVAALLGTSSGRAGNLKGMLHLTAVLQHTGTTVMPKAQPISLIDGLLNEDRSRLIDEATIAELRAYSERFVRYVEAFRGAGVGV